MSDQYQAVYDAVRSRFSHFDSNELIDRIALNFSASHAIEMVRQQAHQVIDEYAAPSVMFKPKLYPDGNQWCALYGENLQDGVAGFGDSPARAISDFNKNWHKDIGEKS